MPFLDILITPQEDGSLSTTVYRKPIHTDIYLQWDSSHTVASKYSVVGHSITEPKSYVQDLRCYKKKNNIYKKAPTKCKYPAWALNRVKIKTKAPANNQNRRDTTNSGNNNNQKPYMVVPYYKGLSESLKKICSKHGVQVYFKGVNTIKNLLVAPKDQDPIQKKSGVIYRYKCDRVECDEEYIGESSRTFGERFKEHQKAPSPIYDHFNTTGHNVTMVNFSIVGTEDQNLSRAINEALYIRVNNPSLNRNANTICHIYGMRFCLTPQNQN